MLKRLWHSVRRRVLRERQANLTEYWKDRVRQHGRRSVINLGHADNQFEAVTEYQKEVLFPLLKTRLSGSEASVLDFGCGPGRFSDGLVKLTGAAVTAVDIIPELLELAPESARVTYQCIGMGSLPFADSSFDLVWSCLVLGGIPDAQIGKSIAEIERVLRSGGLFFFVENTASAANTPYWFFRDEDAYIRLTAFCAPEVLGRYTDIGQRITIFAGRK